MAQRLLDARLHERPLPAPPHDAVPRRRRARVQPHHVARVHARLHAALVLRVVGDGEGDGALVGQVLALAHEQVRLLHAPLLQGGAQRLERRLAARDDHQAGGVGVQAVHDARLARAVADAEQLGVATEQRVGEGARLPGTERRGGLARRLVHHQDLRALEAHLERGVGRRDRRGVRVGDAGGVDGEHVALGDQRALGQPPAVDAHQAIVDGLLEPRARQAGGERRGRLVQAHAIQLRRDDELLQVHAAAHRSTRRDARLRRARGVSSAAP